MKIKFTNLYKLIPKKKFFKKLNILIKKSVYVGGDEVKKFEKNFSNFVSVKYCISVANGTDALEIAIKSLNLKKGSEIIVPNNTWISTAEAVVNNGFKLVLCDINLDDYLICLNDLKKKINNKTSAIIPVHLYGNPVNIKNIKKIIKNKSIKIIEDCAQAHGSKIYNKHVGSLGDVGAFSFFPSKNIGALGDAGAITTNSKKIYNYCLRYRNHGSLAKYDHSFPGRNSRLDAIQALILNIKLLNYKKVIKKRNIIANIYFKELKKISKIELIKRSKYCVYSFHQFVIRCANIRKLKEYLYKNEIETMVHYPYMLNELSFFNNNKRFKKSHKLGNKILSLPISEEHTIREIKYVVKNIKNFFNIF
jgi:dTDP-4-amino-4,6-dideoxygalactose transaminase